MPYENGMLTPEEIEPTAEDLEFAAKLIQDGYESISNRYRTVVRFIEKPFSKADDIRALAETQKKEPEGPVDEAAKKTQPNVRKQKGRR